MNIESLAQVPIFQKCSRVTLEKIFSMATSVQFSDGATIFSEESLNESFYIIEKGEVVIFKSFPKKYSEKADQSLQPQEKIIATLQKGDFFGEISLLGQVPRSASARAKGDTVLLEIEGQKFWHFIKSDPAEALQVILPLAQTISERLRQTTLEFAAIYELSKIFSSGLNRKNLTMKIIEEIITVLPTGSFAALSLWNEFNDEFEWASVSHPEKLSVEMRRTFSSSEPIQKFLNEKRTHFLSENWKEESRLLPEEKNLYGYDKGTLLVIPLLKTEKPQSLSTQVRTVPYPLLGFIFCCDPEKNSAFDRQTIHLITTIAHLSATTLENSFHLEAEEARNRHAHRTILPFDHTSSV